MAAWIVRERRRLKLKPRDIVDRLAAQGLVVTEATVKVWEANGDRRPAPENIEGLERIFESQAPGAEQSAPTDYAAVVAAIDRQTAMLERVLIALGGRGLDPENQAAARRLELEAMSRSDPVPHPETDTAR